MVLGLSAGIGISGSLFAAYLLNRAGRKLTERDHNLQESEVLHFNVIDTGIGIAPENISKLFKPFVQLDSSLSRRYAGTGLGLALVRRIVELHGGSVSLESELGEGSRFTLTLPWKQSEQMEENSLERQQALAQMLDIHQALIVEDSEPAAKQVARYLAEQGTAAYIHPCGEGTVQAALRFKPDVIILAEDNEANIATLADYLLLHKFRVSLARNGLEAVQIAKQQKPDLILMDIQMPEMDGLEATRLIRAEAELATLPIIAFTALAMPGDRERCLGAGATEYLTKPVGLKKLTKIITQYIKPVASG